MSTRSVGGSSAEGKWLFWEGSEEAHKTQYSNTRDLEKQIKMILSGPKYFLDRGNFKEILM